jgi:hypothetical protein
MWDLCYTRAMGVESRRRPLGGFGAAIGGWGWGWGWLSSARA